MNEPYRPVVQFRRMLRAYTGQSPPILCPDIYRDGLLGRFSSCRLLRQRLLRPNLAPIRRQLVAPPPPAPCPPARKSSSAPRTTATTTRFLGTSLIDL